MSPTEYQKAIYTGRICPYCKENTDYVISAEAYDGAHFDMIYLCRHCWAGVGVHNGTNIALGD